LPHQHAVAGNFNLDGTAHTRAYQLSCDAARLEQLSQRKRLIEWPLRQWLYLRLFMDEFVGITGDVYEQRYQNVAEKGERYFNVNITNVLRNLELPSNPFSSAGTFFGGGGKQRGPSRLATASECSSSTRDGACRVPSTAESSEASYDGGSPSSNRTGGGGREVSLQGYRRHLQRPRQATFGWRKPTAEEVAKLPISSELELAAMAPSEHMLSGAISPPSSDEIGYSR